MKQKWAEIIHLPFSVDKKNIISIFFWVLQFMKTFKKSILRFEICICFAKFWLDNRLFCSKNEEWAIKSWFIIQILCFFLFLKKIRNKPRANEDLFIHLLCDRLPPQSIIIIISSEFSQLPHRYNQNILLNCIWNSFVSA